MSWLLPIVGVTLWASFKGFKDRAFRSNWLLVPYKVHYDRQGYRLLTHGFIHADTTHLFLNMFVLWQFGGGVEDALRYGELDSAWLGLSGQWTFAVLYFGGMLAAGLPALSKHKDNPNYASLGASGAVSAVLMAYILLYPTHQLLLFFVIPMPAVVAGVLFFVYESHMNRKGRTGIAHDAHLVGAAFGAGLMLAYEPELLADAFEALRAAWNGLW